MDDVDEGSKVGVGALLLWGLCAEVGVDTLLLKPAGDCAESGDESGEFDALVFNGAKPAVLDDFTDAMSPLFFTDRWDPELGPQHVVFRGQHFEV